MTTHVQQLFTTKSDHTHIFIIYQNNGYVQNIIIYRNKLLYKYHKY